MGCHIMPRNQQYKEYVVSPLRQGFQARSKDQEILEEEVELDPHFCPEEIMSREVELG